MEKKKVKPLYLHIKHQRTAQSKKRFQVLVGGRGGMKTKAVGSILIAAARSERNIKILCTRKFQSSVRESVYAELVDTIRRYKLEDEFEIQDKRIRHKTTNSIFIFMGLQNIAEIKSIQGIKYVWIEEAQFITKEQFETLTPTIRTPGSKFYIVFNPKKEDDYVYDRFITNSDPLALVVWTSYRDNPFFKREIIGSVYDEMLYDKKTNRLKYEHVWLGQLEKAPEGALWNMEMIRYHIAPTVLEKIVISLDPSGTSNSKSDACGIVVAGKTGDHYYVLEDKSSVMSPQAWATVAVQLYYKYEATEIIYETNFGADMVKTIIHQIDKDIPVRGVRATKGKIIRAEPISFLYEEARVFHIKTFKDLEYEMMTYTGDKSEKSPNRLDALVWALTALSKKRSTISTGYTTAAPIF